MFNLNLRIMSKKRYFYLLINSTPSCFHIVGVFTSLGLVKEQLLRFREVFTDCVYSLQRWASRNFGSYENLKL